ncbi:MAG: fumarylacetoacetate hydrolase family protein [Acidimicrobiales bacterium]
MRLTSFVLPEGNPGGPSARPRTGVLTGAGHSEIVDLTDPVIGLPGDMVELLGLGPAAKEAVAGAASSGARRWGLDEVELLAPVPLPPKMLAIGRNYAAHIKEMGWETPKYQYWFNKQRTCVTGPGAPILLPAVSEQLDYEGELAIVIGQRAKGVPAARWLDVVAGFTVVNDVSVRDWQAHSPTYTMGKSFDTHGPTGPYLVTPDEVGDTGDLSVRTWVNDELRQDARTSLLLFGCAQLIEYLTTVFPLEPGDILCTGTPAGVGKGFDPPRWLRAGDTVRIEIENVGVLENPIVAEPAAAPAPAPSMGSARQNGGGAG